MKALRLVEVVGTRRETYVLRAEVIREDGNVLPVTVTLVQPIEIVGQSLKVKVVSYDLAAAIKRAAEPLIKAYKHAEEVRNNWAVIALVEGPGAAVRGKLLPYQLFSRLKASGDVYYTSPEDVEEEDLWFDEGPGWHVTPRGAEVIKEEAEKVIALDPELRAEVERRLAKREEEARREAHVRELVAELVRLERELDDVEKAEGRYLETRDYVPEGERVDDPRWPENIYGGGRWWIIEPSRIIAVHNNGGDGDDWSKNNIRTGGAGAIGFGIPLTPERIAALRRIAEIGTELKALGYGDPDVIDAYAREVA